MISGESMRIQTSMFFFDFLQNMTCASLARDMLDLLGFALGFVPCFRSLFFEQDPTPGTLGSG